MSISAVIKAWTLSHAAEGEAAQLRAGRGDSDRASVIASWSVLWEMRWKRAAENAYLRGHGAPLLYEQMDAFAETEFDSVAPLFDRTGDVLLMELWTLLFAAVMFSRTHSCRQLATAINLLELHVSAR